MTKNQIGLFNRPSLDKCTAIPDSIISVYVVEQHIWSDGGLPQARAERRVEQRTIEDSCRPGAPFLERYLPPMAAPYIPNERISSARVLDQAGSPGKSQLLSFIGALAMAGREWQIIQDRKRPPGNAAKPVTAL